ncbi:MAG TPA: hypothetical protein VJ875_10730 [Pyrinomonadaceae bacterium]|nr:hypothetical protein [Pyrinomonadaceae bacterium]
MLEAFGIFGIIQAFDRFAQFFSYIRSGERDALFGNAIAQRSGQQTICENQRCKEEMNK